MQEMTPEELIERLKATIITDKDGNKFWYLHGKLHRVDGPALEWADGTKHWYLNGTRYTEEEYKLRIEFCESFA